MSPELALTSTTVVPIISMGFVRACWANDSEIEVSTMARVKTIVLIFCRRFAWMLDAGSSDFVV